MKLINRKALITGGSTGMGREIALAFAREGADVAINYLGTEQAAQELKALIEEKYRTNVMIIEADVSEEQQVEKMVSTVLNTFGSIDTLVNSAGIVTQNLLIDLSTEQWDQMIKVNLRGPFLCTKFVLPHMLERKFGRIISISSQIGQKGGVELTHYSAAKAGVIGFTKALAREVGAHGITVNCIAPGPVDTNFVMNLDDNWRDEKQKELTIPRFGKPEEIAPSAVLLASVPDGNIYTGQTLGPNSGDVML